MKVKLFLLVLFTFIFSSTQIRAQRISSSSISKVGTTVAQFLKIGVSARSIGMGGAFVSVANDVSAIYLNPAGLSRIHAHEAMFTHTDWIADTDYDFGAISLDLGGLGTIGLMVVSFSSGDMPVTTVEQPDGTSELFSTQDIAIGLAYARNLTNNFSIGFTGKYISQRIWHMKASTMAIDAGVLFRTPFWGINLGASITNFGSKMRLDGRDSKFAYDPDNRNVGNVYVVNSEYEMQDYAIPLYFQVGLSKNIIENDYNRLTLAIDAVTPNDNYEAVNTGFEYGWKEMLFIRAGYKSLFQNNSEEGLTAGFGVNLRLVGTTIFKFDYAYADLHRLGDAQRFTLSIRF